MSLGFIVILLAFYSWVLILGSYINSQLFCCRILNLKRIWQKSVACVGAEKRIGRVDEEEYSRSGNISELKNVIGRAVLISQEHWISVSDLNLEISLPKEEETQWTEEEKA